MIFTDRVNDITYQEILPSIVDQINNSNVFTARVLSNPKKWRGTSLQQPITIANSNTGGSFDGMDTFSTAATNNTRLMTWYVKGYEQSVVVPGIERVVNSDSEKQVLALLASRMDEARNSASNAIGSLLYDIGSGKNFDGLGLIVDNGTNTASYAGLTRSTNPYINADVTAATNGILTLDLLSIEFDNASAASSNNESPTMGLTTKSIWSLLEGLLAPTVQAMYTSTQVNGYNRVSGGTPTGTSLPAGSPELKGVAGFNAITYRGRPVVADDKATTGSFFWINENYLGFYSLTDDSLKSISSTNQVTEGFYKNVPMPSAFQFRELMAPVNQYGEVGFLVLLGNLVHKQPRRNGKLTGITTN